MRFILLSALLCLQAHAADFSKANELFAKRENNLEAIHKSMNLYREILNTSSNAAEKSEAMTQLGRLAFYEGELLTPEEETERRMEIFAQCQKDAEAAGSAYWKTLALGLWSKSAGIASAWWYLDELKNSMNKTLIEEPLAEDGGIFRILAAIYVNNIALSVYNLYDLDLGLQYANKAVELGPNRIDAHLVKVYVLYQSGKTDESKALLQWTIATFSKKENLDPESKYYFEKAQKSAVMF